MTGFNFLRRKVSSTKAFTLVELMVSVFILGVVVTGIFSVFSANKQLASRTRHSFIASGLVQEGIEVTRNLRDSDWIAGKTFGSFGLNSVAPDGNYTVQYDSKQLMSSGDIALYLNSSTGVYSHTSASSSKTIYNREINILTPPGTGPIQKVITVTVWWLERNQRIEVKAEEHLYNWL